MGHYSTLGGGTDCVTSVFDAAFRLYLSYLFRMLSTMLVQPFQMLLIIQIYDNYGVSYRPILPLEEIFLFISYPIAEWRSGKAHIGTDTYCAFDFKINEKQTNMSLSDEFCLGHTHQSLISQDKLLQREDFHVHRRNAEILSILYILGVFPLLSISRPFCVLKLCLGKEVINIKALHKFLRMILDFFLFYFVLNIFGFCYF